jgi:uncharacterized coiled-coil protein SlyX
MSSFLVQKEAEGSNPSPFKRPRGGDSVVPAQPSLPNINPGMTVSELAALLLPKLDSIESKLCGNEARIEKLEVTVQEQAQTITMLTEQRDRLMDEIRRQNLLIHGLPEIEKNTDELADSILTFLKQANLDVQIDAPVRLGWPVVGKIRPVKFRLPLLSHKSAVLQSRQALKGCSPSMYVTEDLCPSTRVNRKLAFEAKNQTTGVHQSNWNTHTGSGRPGQR